MEDLVTGPPVKAESYRLLPGDRLLLDTDGVIEARNRDNSFFALAEAMEGVHADTPHAVPGTPAPAIAPSHRGPLADDVAMILIDRLS
ncbi:SpoIIE family protein phosphatase [Streptomyces sp. NPDC057291]|uniref:SpoIIE family protein phosphatase n=1 Tax=Streptomyces sp. NPDC057291 TaxID=3346087 RepID=UPI00362501F3